MTDFNYGERETLNLLWDAADAYSGYLVPGKTGPITFNDYVSEDVLGEQYGMEDVYTPIGAVLHHLDVDVAALEEMAKKHLRLCYAAEDPDEPCVVCAEGADSSIHSQWVKDLLRALYGIVFSEAALDLLWSAETSGLDLTQWIDSNYPERPSYAMRDYQDQAQETAIYPPETALQYLVSGLAGEVGEVASLYAKSVRKDRELDQRSMLAEIGDVLWFVAQIATELGASLDTVAQNNLSKLQDRKERGVLQGNGDNR